ncbi:hypothetical protein ACLB2K_020825 [Fragaria x ananassa]
MPVSAMLPKFRTSKRKAFFRTPENLQPELTGHETAAPSHCYENEGASGSNHSKKKKRCDQYNPNCIDVCHMNESVPVTSSVSYGQTLYQRSRQGLITDYEDSGDSSFGCDHCGAYFWKGEALANSIRTNSTVPIYTRCCQKGEIQIPLSDSTPPFLQQYAYSLELFIRTHVKLLFCPYFLINHKFALGWETTHLPFLL